MEKLQRFISAIHHERVVILLLISIIIVAGFIRFHNLGEHSLWIDEGYSINAAQQTIENSYPILDSGNTYTNQYLATYIIAGSMKLFGFDAYNPWSARLPSAIVGTLMILLVFLVTKRLFSNSWIALAAAIFVAFLPWEIAWSRQARGYMLLQFFLLLSFDQLLAYIRSQKITASLFAVLLMGIACLIHTMAIVFIPAFFFTLAVWLFLEKKKLNIITFIPFLFFLVGGLAFVLMGNHHLTIYNYLELYNGFILQHYLITSILALLGTIFILFNKKTFIIGTCFLSIFVFTYLIIALLGPTVQLRYLVAFVPFLAIMIAYGVFIIPNTLIRNLKKIKKLSRNIPVKKIIPYISYGTPILVIIIMISCGTFSLKTVSKLESDSPQPNFAAAYSYIATYKTNNDIIVSPYAHLSKIYLENPGMLLPISLTGKAKELKLTITRDKTDYYTNAPALVDNHAIFSLINTKHGYIVMDSMAQKRIPNIFEDLTNHPRVNRVFSHQENDAMVWVFKY